MDVFVARQAIFDRSRRVYAYELLYRPSDANQARVTDDSAATSHVISNTFLGSGVEALLAGRPGFINFAEALLVAEAPTMLPPERVVVEILESVRPDPAVIGACEKLKRLGYKLALDDFTGDTSVGALLELADFIKVDFRAVTAKDQERLIRRHGRSEVRMLAEKVETQDEFERAKNLGYELFQGYFLARPVVSRSSAISPSKLHYLRLLKEVRRPELDFDGLAHIVGHDVSLSYKLLRYLNSVAFNRAKPLVSIAHGLAFLGEQGVRKWATVVTLSSLAHNKPPELIVSAMLRARFGELAALQTHLAARSEELFVLGMFSFLDAVLDRPLNQILDELYLPQPMRSVLLGQAPAGDGMATLFRAVLAYEAAEWEALPALADAVAIPTHFFPNLYEESVEWVDSIFR